MKFWRLIRVLKWWIFHIKLILCAFFVTLRRVIFFLQGSVHFAQIKLKECIRSYKSQDTSTNDAKLQFKFYFNFVCLYFIHVLTRMHCKKKRTLLIAFLFSTAFFHLTSDFRVLLFTPLSAIRSFWHVNSAKQNYNLTTNQIDHLCRRPQLQPQLLLLLLPLSLLSSHLMLLNLHTASTLLASVNFSFWNFTDTVWPVPATPSNYTSHLPKMSDPSRKKILELALLSQTVAKHFRQPSARLFDD